MKINSKNFTEIFLRENSSSIQDFCEVEEMLFEEVWYIDSSDIKYCERISPLFSFDDDVFNRADEKKKLDMIRDMAVSHYEGKCVYCEKSESEIASDASIRSKRRKLELDHFLIPFSEGGQLVLGISNIDENIPILSNCVVSCPSCNSRKKNKSVAEFMKDDFPTLLLAVKNNAKFTNKLRAVYEAENFKPTEYIELIFENLGLNQAEIESEIKRRYPNCTLKFQYGHAPSFDPRDVPGYSGQFIPHAYQYSITWHLVSGELESYDRDGNLIEYSESIEGEETYYDPFSAGHEIKKAWEKWLIDHPVSDDEFEDDMYDEGE